MIKIKLSHPINDGKIHELTINEPTFGMLQKHGLPVNGKEIDLQKAGGLLEACTGVPLPFLQEMKGKDSLRVVGALAELLADDEGNSD